MMCRTIPYEGQEPYIFLSYCHKDADRVYPLLEQLTRDGYRVWYDDGNRPGDNWLENIAQHLSDCRVCLAMVSENSGASHNCRNEINFAIECDKKLMAILIEDFVMPLGMRLQLGTIHYLKKDAFPSDHALLQKLYETEELKACRGEPGKLPMREIPEETAAEQTPAKKQEVLDFVGAEKKSRIRTSIVLLPDEEEKAETEPEQEVAAEPEQEAAAEPEQKVAAEPEQEAAAEPEQEDKTEPEQEAAAEPAALQEQKPQTAVTEEEEPEEEPEEETGASPEAVPEQIPEEVSAPEQTPEEVFVDDEDEPTVYAGSLYDETEEEDDEDARTIRAERHQTVVLLHLTKERGYVFESAQIEIGRSKRCDVVLADNPYIGSHHADIIQYKGHCYLRDRGSVNGTFVGEEQVEAEGQVRLENQTVFRLYDETFVFFCGPQARQLAAQERVYFVRNPQTQGLKTVFNETLPLDRSHKWEDGTMSDREISRHPHAAIMQQDDMLFLMDMGHQNGVYHNRRKLAPKEACLLKSGDRFRIGQTVLEAGIVTLKGEN